MKPLTMPPTSPTRKRRQDRADTEIDELARLHAGRSSALGPQADQIPEAPGEGPVDEGEDHRNEQRHQGIALLARAPAAALVDELAHRNIPGTRHARRYQDIEKLLARGIDVWTTVNIQHLERLNDLVAGITGVRMRETVPDSLIARARREGALADA